ncbi:metallophosphoesterase [Nitrosophilus labii]|uniref:metallophosphoesterase n=1 Tax=Nitrosophilus labii TaxID=2706014 RepID=UPI002483BADA|nr:metallophosphoesterase [Nitrosophilus labii]
MVYGDIHGCLEEFLALRKKIDIKKDDIEISVGDFIAKGPYSLDTLRFLEKRKILCVRGNHEDKFIRYKLHYDEEKRSGKKNPMKLEEEEKKFFFSLKEEDFRFLSSTKFYLKIGSLTVVHAGITNKIFLSRATKKAYTQVMRVRFVDEKGDFVTLDETDKKGCCYWSEVYDNHEGFIVYGHQPFLKPKIDRFSIGIDTGAVYGNFLSAVVFDMDEDVNISSYRFYFQKSKKAYVKRKKSWLQ